MQDNIPSKTAFRVAMRRAVHQLIDDPKVLDDPLAVAILGGETASALKASPEQFERLGTANLRAFVAARSRFAEDQLATAVEDGVRQYVVLGAGLDTFAYRNPFEKLEVIEVDHPATQAWKRDLLAEAGIAIPGSMSFVAVDFARQTLRAELSRSKFQTTEPAFFSWLGVVPYLTRDAALGTLRWIGSLPSGTAVVFDYAIARTALSFLERTALDALSRRVARAGEPFQLFFEPGELAETLRAAGFQHVEDLGAAEINGRYFANRRDGLEIRGNLGHLIFAQV
ncbi:MAG TPA: class I SAM-dependent methyltransferase [Bryobacteraceae bacterium]|jgi:methyltransferase (TIGR00027 family)|nr:class I SAM-dependent methyltransferase [Bryobacteraceae bacterium]